MRSAVSILSLALLASACIPSFEKVECYNDIDCPGGGDLVCSAENTCVSASADAGFPDSGVAVDAGFPDTGAPDTGVVTEDAGFPDSGVPDSGAPDTGVPDAGFPDAGFPDAGFPDAGFALSLLPSTVDFGVARVGCPGVARQVTLRNDGTTAVQISSVDLSQATPGTFTLSGPATPLNLAPASQRVFDVTYAPVAAGAEAGALEATYGAQSDLLSATLIAEGTVATSQTDNFTQAGGPLDVLLVVDDSPEMMPFQSQLSSDLLFLFLTLDYEGWDYQIGVTSTDVTPTGARGALVGNPPLITPQTPNAETLLEARVLLGENGSGTEEGLEASRLAVTGANAGWPRANAAFLVIYLSDEDDQSPMMVSQYSTIFDNLKGAGNQDLVAASAIVSTATFCTIPDGTLADYGGRYIGMAALTRGTVSHICDSSFQDVLQATPPIPRNQAFTLSARPEPSSVQVYVNNVLIDGLAGANWSYQAASNQVVFSVAQAPALGRPVRITYNIACN